jgi:hypothetical protein
MMDNPHGFDFPQQGFMDRDMLDDMMDNEYLCEGDEGDNFYQDIVASTD